MSEPAWILLRGLSREKGHWGDFVDRFQERVPNTEILAIDLPGTGEFRNVNSPMTIDGIFKFVRNEAIKRVRTQGPFRLLAVSLGAMIAMEWMRQRSEDLAGCVLINTSARELSPFYHRLRWQVWREFMKIIALTNVRDRERAVLDLLVTSESGRATALPLWVKVGNERPVSYRNFLCQLTAAARFSGLTAASSVPVLLLNGLGDRLVEPSCSSQLHDKWGWPIHRHPWAGHDLTWDDPDWVLDKITHWNQ